MALKCLNTSLFSRSTIEFSSCEYGRIVRCLVYNKLINSFIILLTYSFPLSVKILSGVVSREVYSMRTLAEFSADNSGIAYNSTSLENTSIFL